MKAVSQLRDELALRRMPSYTTSTSQHTSVSSLPVTERDPIGHTTWISDVPCINSSVPYSQAEGLRDAGHYGRQTELATPSLLYYTTPYPGTTP